MLEADFCLCPKPKYTKSPLVSVKHPLQGNPEVVRKGSHWGSERAVFLFSGTTSGLKLTELWEQQTRFFKFCCFSFFFFLRLLS